MEIYRGPYAGAFVMHNVINPENHPEFDKSKDERYIILNGKEQELKPGDMIRTDVLLVSPNAVTATLKVYGAGT